MLGISICQLSQLRAKEVLPVTAQMKRVSGCHREHLEQLQCASSHTLSFISMQMYCLYLIPLNLPFLEMARLLYALKNPPTGDTPGVPSAILPKHVFWVVGQNNPFEQQFAHMSHLFISLVLKEKVKAIKPTCLARVRERRHFTAMKWNSQQMRLITQQLGGKEIMWSSFSHQLRITVHKNRHYWGEIQTP